MSTQDIDSQRGEIEFRRGLYRQQVERERIFDDEYDSEGIERILDERMTKTLNRMHELRASGITLSPYLEVGAERCQRSLVMENDLVAEGAAVDISFDMLKSCDYYRGVFKRDRSPLRVCCDANQLPFLSDSVPFVFCYETLHHFPDPAPITKEIHRVMAPGGWFFFDEEPFMRRLRMPLYRRDKSYSRKSLTRGNARRLLDAVFSSVRCNEEDYGIIENDDITLKTWRRALECFDERNVTLEIPRVPSSRVGLYGSRFRVKYAAAYLLGGNISGLCRKSGGDRHANGAIQDALGCPTCREVGKEIRLRDEGAVFVCSSCSRSYPVEGGVLLLFTDAKLQALYPQLSARGRPLTAD